MAGYVCQLTNAPVVTWASTTDQSNPELLIKCDRVDHLTIETSVSALQRWYKIAQLIEDVVIP